MRRYPALLTHRLGSARHRCQLLQETDHFSCGRKKQVAKIVHCGLRQDFFEALVPCLPNYHARKIWKKLSISAVGIRKKLRRLSTVGSTITFQIPSRGRSEKVTSSLDHQAPLVDTVIG
jgi:hypothetical protein